MTILLRILEFVIVFACLPFYAFAWPFMVWDARKVVSGINGRECPQCGSTFAGMTRQCLTERGLRITLKQGAKIARDRLPRWAVSCPACNTTICFDRHARITSCDYRDHISRREIVEE